MGEDLNTLLPGFQADVTQLHSVLLPVCLALGFGGFVREVFLAQARGSVSMLPGYLVKMLIAFSALGLMQEWAGYVTGGVNDINTQLGVNPGNVLASYEQALATKFGGIINSSDSAATVPPAGSNIANGGPTSGGGVEITHYGYPGDPNGDPNSENGIGNHNNHLVAGVSLAFSPDLITEYHLQVGQTVTVTMATGQVLTGRFDDTTANWLTGRVDIYDPNNTVTFSGEAVTQIDGAPAAAGYDTGVARSPVTLFTTAAMGLDGLPAFLLGFFVMVLCVVGMFLMWLMSLLQQMLCSVAIAVSPVFFGLLLVRGLDGIASRFLTGFVAICLWPLGWGIASLITNLLLDFALNTANNLGLGAVNYLSGGVLWWIGLGAWTIGSTVAAPWMISRQIAAGQPGIAALLGEAGGRGLRIAYGTIQHVLRFGLQSADSAGGEFGSTDLADSEDGTLSDEYSPATPSVRVRYGRRPAV
jgi:hypothetical protein